jgi:hypothetical protein
VAETVDGTYGDCPGGDRAEFDDERAIPMLFGGGDGVSGGTRGSASGSGYFFGSSGAERLLGLLG